MRTTYYSCISLFLLYALASCKSQNPGYYNIADFGAKGDGKTMNTSSINLAIEKCNASGGGTVVVPAGNFLTGTIVMHSNVNLHLEPGSVLSGSKDTIDYLVMKDVLFSEGYNRFGIIYANNAKNISITGQGEIFGNGTSFMNGIEMPHIIGDYIRSLTRQGEEFMKAGNVFEDGPVSYPYRPGMMVVIKGCENVQFSDVFFRDSPEWTIRIEDCDNVDIRGITIDNNPMVPNNDGIHCTTSRNVTISDCRIFAGDDAIIVTGFGNLPLPGGDFTGIACGNKTGYSENVAVTNCVLSSRSACVRVGYGNHPIRGLVFNNLVMFASNRGIGIFSRDDSYIENVMFNNITINTRLHAGDWWGKGEPIHISAINSTENGNPGRIKNIRISNIVASGEAGIVIWGDPESIIENVTLDNVQLQVHKGKFTDTFGGNFDLRPSWPPEKRVFKHDIPGLYAGYVRNLDIEDFEMIWGPSLPDFFTYAIEVELSDKVTLHGFKGSSAIPALLPPISMNGRKAD